MNLCRMYTISHRKKCVFFVRFCHRCLVPTEFGPFNCETTVQADLKWIIDDDRRSHSYACTKEQEIKMPITEQALGVLGGLRKKNVRDRQNVAYQWIRNMGLAKWKWKDFLPFSSSMLANKQKICIHIYLFCIAFHVR